MTEHIDYQGYITADPAICHGQPCFRGTRIMVYLILELLEAGESVDQIRQAYPRLTPEHVQAALHYAAELIQTGQQPPLAHAT